MSRPAPTMPTPPPPPSPDRPRTVTVLGATGSVGRSTAAVLRAAGPAFRVEAVAGGARAGELARVALGLGARFAALADPAGYAELKAALAGTGVEAAAGADAVVEAARRPADWVMAAVVGFAGLRATLAAARRGAIVALANKEAVVCAGPLLLREAAAAGAAILPVDSEHNALFQALAGRSAPGAALARPVPVGEAAAGVERLVLTASGGPFRRASLAEMAAATPALALAHPTWAMGAKISIDSATMMNKGLEIIEAHHLFGVPEGRIEVLVHPGSTVHGLVGFADGGLLAHLGAPDMRVAIAHALGWPARLATDVPRLDLARLGRLEFEPPDPARFPALALARHALRAGGGAPTILNAANEVAVDAFLEGRIGFLDIARVAERALERGAGAAGEAPGDLAAVEALDAEARRLAAGLVAAGPAAGRPARASVPPAEAGRPRA